MGGATQFDYIIVGAGSAGCALAYRLTEDPAIRVLLIEAGPTDRAIKLHVPAAFIYNYTSARHNWMYWTEPEPNVNNQPVFCPRGKVLGGSSSINGMAFVRGHALDFDNWAARGAPDWSYSHCLPYFKRMETYSGGADDYRGDQGPLKITRPVHENPLYQVFLEACQQAGYPLSYDTNGYSQEGFSPMDQTIHLGRRSSTAGAYLKPARGRANLTIWTGCQVNRLTGGGNRINGIEGIRKGRPFFVQVGAEVILSAGAINSPQLLMLSGIGPAAHLEAHGIAVRNDVPGVGQNLQDHFDASLQQACTRPISVNSEIHPLNRAKNALRWLARRDGPAATNQSEVAGYIRSTSDHWPDVQISFLPLAIDYEKMRPIAPHGFRLFGMPLRPTSRGEVCLRSADPTAPPVIRANYLSTEKDRQDFRDLIQISREIVAQPAFDGLRGPELEPGADAVTDAQIDDFVRKKGKATHHVCGTCRMGADQLSVVDNTLKVHGVEGLRVADASIMPDITSGNLNAPCIMIGEKAADYLAGRNQLPPVHVPVFPQEM